MIRVCRPERGTLGTVTAAPADPATDVFWRPSAALQIAHSQHRSRRVAQAIVLAICAFTIILTTAPAAFALDVSTAETSVAAQTFTAHTPIETETAGSPTGVGENRAGNYDFTSGCCVAPNTTQIFRAVEPDELTDLRNFGQYRAGGPQAQWMDGKRFWLSQADADAYVDLAVKGEFGGPYCVTSGCVSSDVLRQIEVVTMDGMDAVFIPNELLPLIDDLRLPSPP